MNTNIDTIAAISTAPGDAGISIVRVSGSNSLEIADSIFSNSSQKPSMCEGGRFLHGVIRTSASGEVCDIDEVIMLIYRAPKSYTCEDVVEIQGHGGRASARRILRTVLDAGVRLAEPGEFTKRAFLNGRIDLLQAEAVMDLIRAGSDRAAEAALEQLDGVLSHSVSACYDCMLQVAVDLEATLDFGEDELPVSSHEDILLRLDKARSMLDELLGSWEEGLLLREGAVAVISGKPNVGKSTLLNRLLGQDRAIVSEVPGTTRDTIEEICIVSGVPIRLIDTAGLRDTECAIEREGIERAHSSISKAHLNLHVIDASESNAQSDEAMLSAMDKTSTIVILNKIDLGAEQTSETYSAYTCIECSLSSDESVQPILDAITSRLGIETSAPPHAVISERHRQFVLNALNDVKKAYELLDSGRDDVAVMACAELRDGLESLGTITGKIYTDELLSNIFDRFCVGK